jgi:hypothetical protein
VEEGFYMLFDVKEYTQLFLKNLMYRLSTLKKMLWKIIFWQKKVISDAKYDYNTVLASSTVDFVKLVNEKKAAYFLKLNNQKLDPNFVIL